MTEEKKIEDWINADNLLPANTDEVIHVLYEDGTTDVARFFDGNFWVGCNGPDVKNITHWRPRTIPNTQTKTPKS